MIAVQIILIAFGALLADAHECNCDCGSHGVCDAQTELRTELDENKDEITKWNKHYSFVRSFSEDWQNQVARVVRQQLRVGIHETIEEVKNAFEDAQRDVSIKIEEQRARFESLEKSLRTLNERVYKSDVNMQNISDEMSAIKAECKCQEETQDRPRCGVDNNAGERDNVWPWMAAVYNKDNALVCYGSVIHRHFVLTSAWCPTYKGDGGFTVRLGLTDLKYGDHVQHYRVQSFHIHPNFRRGQGQYDNLDYDIGLLELGERISFGRYVGPVCLPPRDEYYPPRMAVQSVFLGSYIHPPHSEPPTVVNLNVMTREACRREIDRRVWGVYFPNPEFSFCLESPGRCPFRGTPVVQSHQERHDTRTSTEVSVSILCHENVIFGYRLGRLMPWVDGIIEDSSRQ